MASQTSPHIQPKAGSLERAAARHFDRICEDQQGKGAEHGFASITPRRRCPQLVRHGLLPPRCCTLLTPGRADFALLSDRNLALPFFSCQWKASDGDLNTATRQGARDGAAIVNHLRAIWEESGLPYTAVDTCHFSGDCDGRVFEMFVHWPDEPLGKPLEYPMKMIANALLENPADPDQPGLGMAQIRTYLRNIQHHATTTRLHRLQLALRTIYVKRFPQDPRPRMPELFPQPPPQVAPTVPAISRDNPAATPNPPPGPASRIDENGRRRSTRNTTPTMPHANMPPRGRGRGSRQDNGGVSGPSDGQGVPEKRGRGRPRKRPFDE
ncbi:hypothetical protein K491DRAFT_46484 [Lophiostoma macrostomum CBS 122681]|uniref:DUF7924 domain-containing protein n=1 Tax=Lophiostoma macrostomum CBS 122681 TaxID=1314788 RepID=A0A6A6SXQ1_9PLEO|nr:hypothetical protein K491DRAFT_46484 [Lophiostoma macrostomum CBS 122681]